MVFVDGMYIFVCLDLSDFTWPTIKSISLDSHNALFAIMWTLEGWQGVSNVAEYLLVTMLSAGLEKELFFF